MTITAFKESTRLATGGILRKEWRVRPLESFPRGALAEAWGSDWQTYRPYTTHILEERYIRDGVDEGWKPRHTLYNDDTDAVEHIDDGATYVDQRLGRIDAEQRAKRQAEYESRRSKEAAESLAKAQAAERARIAKRSLDAFDKLRDSKDGVWAERWNTFIQRAHDDERLKSRAHGRRDLYDAVIDADTVPSKRKAIREFLAAMGLKY